ncbi:MAG: OmpA family protein, partial [Nitrospirota bacterium]|nr:OmpA family protein [Nitrospirota bacterium]
MNHSSSDATQSGQTKPTLTSLSKSPTLDSSNLTDRMVIPGETEESVSQVQAEAEPFPTIYFPFDSWEITPEVKDRLDATAKWMTHFSRYGLTIEGHTDIRGSESYNMVLGVKRAKAVKEYLANLGIPRTRLDIVSYGNVLVLCDVDD